METSSLVHVVFLAPLAGFFIFILRSYTTKDLLFAAGAITMAFCATLLIANSLNQDLASVLELREPSKASGAMTLIYAFSIGIVFRIITLMMNSGKRKKEKGDGGNKSRIQL